MSVEGQRALSEGGMRPTQPKYANATAMVAALKPGHPVYCVRPHVVKRAARDFLDEFDGRVLYATKCNPHPLILRALYEEGIRHFDTASLNEVAQVRELFRDAECYFMHPVKSRSAIRIADEVYNVEHFVIDTRDELHKVLDEAREEGLAIIVRLATPSAGAAYDLSAKFGAKPAEAVELLQEIKAEGYRAGIGFHVGSQCANPRAFRTALKIVGEVLDAAKVDIAYLDVGGGFPTSYQGAQVPPLSEFFAEIEAGLREIKLRRDCVLMCEPGRALVADGMSLVTQVHLRKGDQLYINDGIYGSLSETVTARLRFPVRPIRLTGGFSEDMIEYTIYGPTCDSTDVLPVSIRLPADMREGDWIEFGRIGAYSNALATRFNGFFPDAYVVVEDDAMVIEGA
ncbi:MAG: type III PLP-dependent enzyme [Elstera sp.]